MNKWIQAYSTVYPVLIDTKSSPGKVYLRKNITEKTVAPEGSEPYILYCYSELVLTLEEYQSSYENPLYNAIIQAREEDNISLEENIINLDSKLSQLGQMIEDVYLELIMGGK